MWQSSTMDIDRLIIQPSTATSWGWSSLKPMSETAKLYSVVTHLSACYWNTTWEDCIKILAHQLLLSACPPFCTWFAPKLDMKVSSNWGVSSGYWSPDYDNACISKCIHFKLVRWEWAKNTFALYISTAEIHLGIGLYQYLLFKFGYLTHLMSHCNR